MGNRMPMKPPTFGTLAKKHYESDADRRADRAFYARTRWRKLRRMILNGSPLCMCCAERDETTEATDVDHIIDRKQRPDLAYDMDNLQTLCKRCHGIKTHGTELR